MLDSLSLSLSPFSFAFMFVFFYLLFINSAFDYLSFSLILPLELGTPSTHVLVCCRFRYSAKMQLVHVMGDILDCPPSMSIAHCVSLDGKMGAGLARTLQARFHLRQDFLQAPREVGGAVALRRGNRFIVNLITKERFFHLPSGKDFEQSIQNLRKFLIFNNIREIAVPELGAGLDKLDLDRVIATIKRVLKYDPVVVYMHHI